MNMWDKNGKTLLFYAVTSESPERIKYLLAKGADVNKIYAYDRNLLFVRPDQIFYRGYIPIGPYAIMCHCGPRSNLRTLDNIKILLREGIKVNVKDEDGMTALDYFLFLCEAINQTSKEREYAMLLFAAGDTVDETQVKVANYLKPPAESQSLKNICRETIRKHLLQMSDVNLFARVPQLSLKRELTSYLLYDVTLD